MGLRENFCSRATPMMRVMSSQAQAPARLNPGSPDAPLLRGWIHAAALPVFAVAGTLLVMMAKTEVQRAGSVVLTASVTLILGASAFYHRGPLRSTRFSEWARRLDHSAIFVGMAGIYTAYKIVALSSHATTWLLWAAWLFACAGVVKKLVWLSAPRWISAGTYIVFGLSGLIAVPELSDVVGLPSTAVLLLSGTLLVAGGLCYALRRPNPLPRWFAFHEVFHTLVVIALAIQFSVFARIVSGW